MKKYYFTLFSILVIFGATVFFAGTPPIFGQQGAEINDENITYPVAELGGCGDKAECGAYCDKSENMEACINFAEANDLLPEEDIAMARKMLELGEAGGPGGCQGQAECSAYCDDISHIKECVAFAEENDLIPADELAEAKKVIVAIDQGITPPSCGSKAKCDVYCKQPENMQECLVFAEAAGLIPPDELAEAKQVLAAIEKGAKPPACGGKAECDEYCAAPENFEECITFAEAAGFVSAEEALMARKTGGKGPGGCRGKEVCESFCEDPAHADECVDFAVQYGFMAPEEAEQAKKMMAAGIRGGPGGCEGKEACEAFCEDPANMVECVDFAEKAGFMTPEEAARGRKMAEMGISGGPGGCKGEEECRAFCENPENGEICLDFAVKVGDMSPEQAEQMRMGAEAMQSGGPGGCRGEEECKSFCDDPNNNEECFNFAVEQGIISPEDAERMQEMRQSQQMMPGGGQPEEGMMPEGEIPEGMMPEGGMPSEGMTQPPSAEEIERMQAEETQRIMQQEQQRAMEEVQQQTIQQQQEQIQQQMQQQQTEQQIQEQTQQQIQEQQSPPQSFLDKAKNFLAGISLLFGFPR